MAVVEIGARQLADLPAEGEAGVRHDDVEAPKGLDGSRHELRREGRSGEVTAQSDGLPAMAGDLLGDLRAALLILSRMHEDARAGGEAPADGRPDAAAGTGHNRRSRDRGR